MAHVHGAPTEGQVIHWAGLYDRMLTLLTVGRETGFRKRTVDAAGLQRGERVLDVGCGTGTLALAAADTVGPAGEVVGIDPSAEMIARARSKASDRALDVRFEVAAIEALPFDAGHFDAVLSSLMFHHLPAPLQRAGLLEVRRVLAPGGRLTLVDFVGRGPRLHRLIGGVLALRRGHRGHGGHGHGQEHGHEHGLEPVAALARELGFEEVAVAGFRPRFLGCLTARAPAD